MNICATIAEFNPFHNGHSYLINAVKHDYDATVAIMSGNFVQRGAPAVYDKFSRAKAAVLNGVDLVIELPLIYSLSSAETFALGAVKTLNASNCINTLFFGSETGDIDSLREIASLALNESDSFKELLHSHLSSGLSYPKALANVYASYGFSEEIVSSPNNILGIEYIKALIRTKSTITPITLKRHGAAHDSFVASSSIASASHIRSLIEKGSFTQNFMPAFPYPAPVFEKQFSDIILYALKAASFEELVSIPDCSAELASRFLTASNATDISDIINYVKAKNFTESRIRRILWNLVLKNNISPASDPSYIRILAQSKRGSEVISYMKKNASLPIIQKGVELKKNTIFLMESKATNIYNIVTKHPSGEDFRHSPIPIC